MSSGSSKSSSIGEPCFNICTWEWSDISATWMQQENYCDQDPPGCECPPPPGRDGFFDGEIVPYDCSR